MGITRLRRERATVANSLDADAGWMGKVVELAPNLATMWRRVVSQATCGYSGSGRAANCERGCAFDLRCLGGRCLHNRHEPFHCRVWSVQYHGRWQMRGEARRLRGRGRNLLHRADRKLRTGSVPDLLHWRGGGGLANDRRHEIRLDQLSNRSGSHTHLVDVLCLS
eukprot:SAG11_NODE_3114_length_2677_cov_1.685415_2_plen_166_part_00